MTSRGFFGSCLAAAAVMLLPAAKVLGFEEAEVVDIDWLRFTIGKDEAVAYGECRFRVNGGRWQKKFFWLKPPTYMAPLTKNVSVGFKTLWSNP